MHADGVARIVGMRAQRMGRQELIAGGDGSDNSSRCGTTRVLIGRRAIGPFGLDRMQVEISGAAENMETRL